MLSTHRYNNPEMTQDDSFSAVFLSISGNLDMVIGCLTSLITYTNLRSSHLYVIDNSNDEIIHQYLLNLVDQNFIYRLVSNLNELNSYQLINASELSSYNYVSIIRSCILVTPNWINRLIDCVESRGDIDIATTISNKNSNIELPVLPGTNYFSIDQYLQKISQRKYPEASIITDCILLKQRCISDENLLYKAIATNEIAKLVSSDRLQAAIADNLYVYQHLTKERGKLDFSSTTGISFKSKKLPPQLKYLKAHFSTTNRWVPLKFYRERYRELRYNLKHFKFIGAASIVWKCLTNVWSAYEPVLRPQQIEKLTRHNRIRITYILHNITVAGGVFSVIQLVNELILLGAEVRLACLYQYKETKFWNLYTEPLVYRNANDLIENLPETDIVVATHWTTSPWAAEIEKRQKATSVYFLQDYEPWFFDSTDIDRQESVKATYQLIQNKIVKSDWLKSMLLKDGYKTQKIHFGLNLGIFYPKLSTPSRKLTLLAMARPRTPRRGFGTLTAALSLIKNNYPNVQVVLFGDDLAKHNVDFDYIDKGVISSQKEVAELHSSADIFIDASDFQGFGRTALEAMATKTACILTDVGGVNEYAKTGVNCLLVSPNSPIQIYQAFQKLYSDTTLMHKLQSNGLKTAKKFCHKDEASKTLDYFESIAKKSLAT